MTADLLQKQCYKREFSNCQNRVEFLTAARIISFQYKENRCPQA